MEIFDENFGIFVYRSIENNSFVGLLRFEMKRKFARQIKHLRIKCPAIHVFVKIGNIRIVVDGFVEGLKTEAARKKTDHRRFSRADVSGYGDKSCRHCFLK